MIIDAHTHLFGSKDWWPQWVWDAVSSIQAARSGKPVEFMARHRDESFDSTGNIAIANMDRAGVDKAVVCVVDLGLAVPGEDTKISIEEINRLTCEIVKKHPDRLYFSVGVDPRRRNALEILEMGVKELGAKTVKLYPATGWSPSDRIAYPLYERCADWGVPVNFHTGPVFGPMKSKFTHPLLLDELASDFPDLGIYCTHCGHGSYMEMLAIARARTNIFCDMAAWLAWFYSGEGLEFYRTWRYITNMLGAGRMLFASDQTGPKFTPELKDEYVDWVTAVTQIPDWVRDAGITFSQEELEGYFSKNAIRLLKLD
ncbi:MAG: amidohydrolase [Deltaproteobacteria bacterium]|nr:amidohydrolase [Deltaproteobacteria bacterium]MBW1816069.1 amidohydrolase [Deltaproteobacteria bacterium]